jgi:hypothetical protein
MGGLGAGLKALPGKVGDKIGKTLDKVLGDQPDSAAAAARNNPADAMPFSEIDEAAAGFPSELR